MRLIKFRGYSIEEKNWVYGSLIQHPAFNYPIIDTFDSGGRFFVYPESVGQCTDAKDMEGKTIYEGDIMTHYKSKNTGTVQYCHALLSWIVGKDKFYFENLSICRYNWIVTGNSYQPTEP